jgi:hypothetical protein
MEYILSLLDKEDIVFNDEKDEQIGQDDDEDDDDKEEEEEEEE